MLTQCFFFRLQAKRLSEKLHRHKDEFLLKLGHECTKSVQLFSQTQSGRSRVEAVFYD